MGNDKSINCYTIKKRIADFELKNILYLMVGILPVFLLTNKFFYAPVAVILLLSLISIIYFFKGTPITLYHFKTAIILVIIGSYLLFSYFISNQSPANLFSFGFLRYDGSFFFCYLAFFIFGVQFLNYKKALQNYFSILFLVFVFFGILGIFEFINNEYFFTVRLDDIYLGPIFIALNNAHNATGSVYAVTGVAAAAFFIESENKSSKVFYGSTFLILLTALLITKSRGSLAGFIAGTVFILLLSSRSFLKLARNIGLLIAGLAVFVFATGTYKRILQMFMFEDASSLTRFSLWEKAILLIKSSPVLGVGFGRYNDIPWHYSELPLYEYSGLIRLYNENRAVFNDTNAHNSYLGVASETGFIGLALFLFFWIFIFYIFIRAYRRKDTAVFSKQVYLTVAGFVAALFILSLTENYMTAPTLMMLLSVTISLSLGLLNEKRPDR